MPKSKQEGVLHCTQLYPGLKSLCFRFLSFALFFNPHFHPLECRDVMTQFFFGS